MAEAPPLSFEDFLRVLRVVGNRAVLVGGQAVAWWASIYAKAGRLAEVSEPMSVFVSRDVDCLSAGGPAELAPILDDLAEALRGEISQSDGWNVPLVAAAVAFEDSASRRRRVDFLVNVHGVKNRDDVFDTAVRFVAEGGLPDVYVMHPVLLFETRIANVVDLTKYQNDKGIEQARVASWVVREWLVDELDDGWAGARKRVNQAIRISLSPKGVAAAAQFGIDSFASVPESHPNLPAAFLTERYPRAKQLLEKEIRRYRGKPSFLDGL